MPAFQCQMYFFDRQIVFCETFYTVKNTFHDAMVALDTLSLARQVILPGNIQLGKLRVATEPADRNVVEAGVRQILNRPPGELIYNSTIINFTGQAGPTGGNYHRAMSMRGVPSGLHNPGSPWWFALNTYLQVVINLGFCLQVSSKEQPLIPVIGLAVVGTDNVDSAGNPLDVDTAEEASLTVNIATSIPHGIPLYDPTTGRPSHVRTRRLKWQMPDGTYLALNSGSLKVLGTTPQTITVRGATPTMGSQDQAGYVKLDQKAYVPIVAAVAKFDPTRKTGGRSKVRPSSLPPYAQQVPALGPYGVIPPVPPPFAPGAPSPLVPITPIDKPTRVLKTALDVVMMCHEGYDPQPDGKLYPIRVAKVLNFENCYAIILSGTDLHMNQATGITEDILSSFGIPDSYAANLRAVLDVAVPRGSYLYIAGDSLGGMEAQLLQDTCGAFGIKIVTMLTFNSPVTTTTVPNRLVRFAEHGDQVISASPLGALLALLAHPEQFFFSEERYVNPVTAHLAIYTDPLLSGYDTFGYPFGGSPGLTLQLGFISLFQVPIIH